MTPTIGSTEFLKAIIADVIGLALIIIGVFKSNEQLVTLGITLLTGSTIGYQVSRGLAKFGTGASASPPATDADAAKKVAQA